MATQLRPLDTATDLDAAIAAAGDRPLLIFKHSLTCGTSAFAFEELGLLAAEPPVAMDICVVVVQTARALSNTIADRWKVRHESPQAFVLLRGDVRWHASHHRLTSAAMAEAVTRAAHDADSTLLR